jgi:hypothetical protein
MKSLVRRIKSAKVKGSSCEKVPSISAKLDLMLIR